MSPGQAVLAAALSLAALAALAQPVRFGLDAELEHDDNVPRGLLEEDRRSDTIASVGASATHSTVLGPRSGVVLRGGARYAHFAEFEDISPFSLHASASYRVQPVVGFSAPWIELLGELQWLRHGDSELRDGSIAALTASVGSHLTDRVRVSAGAGASERSGGDPGLYDLSTTRVFATLDYRVGIGMTLYGRVARIAGDHVFTAIDPTSQGYLADIYDVRVADPALASGFNGTAPLAYRLEATSMVYDLGLNYPLGGTQAIDVSLTYYTAKPDLDYREYDGTQFRVSYLYRFQ
jgi:hypothetical protein